MAKETHAWQKQGYQEGVRSAWRFMAQDTRIKPGSPLSNLGKRAADLLTTTENDWFRLLAAPASSCKSGSSNRVTFTRCKQTGICHTEEWMV